MTVFTIGHDQTIKQHLDWCREVLAENEASIAKFESGEMRIGEGNKDMTGAWVKRLKDNNEALRRVIAAFAPDTFQAQVKA